MDFEIIEEPITIHDFTNNLWITLNNYYPFTVNRTMNWEEFADATEWLESRNIKYMLDPKWSRVQRGASGSFIIGFKFQSKGNALLFNLGTSY